MKKSTGELTIVIVVFIAVALLAAVSNLFVKNGKKDVEDRATNVYSNLLD